MASSSQSLAASFANQHKKLISFVAFAAILFSIMFTIPVPTHGLVSDDDGDGLSNNYECPEGPPYEDHICLDTDGDGYPDYNDLDSDEDGLSDQSECFIPIVGSCPDTDGDDIPDHADGDDFSGGPGDSDGDGLTDDIECPPIQGQPAWPACADKDGDLTPDYMEVHIEGPGGVSDGLEMWLRAEDYKDYSSSGDFWPDQSGKNHQATVNNGSVSLETNSINSNPTINFGRSSGMLVDGTFNNRKLKTFGVVRDTNTGVMRADGYGDNGDGYGPFFGSTHSSPVRRLPYSGIANGSDIMTMVRYFGSGIVEASSIQTPSLNGNRLFIHEMDSFKEKEIALTINGAPINLIDTGQPTPFANIQMALNHLEGASGEIIFSEPKHAAEAIVFNRELNNTERSKVNTYLAIKYGLTLDTAGSDYLSSSGNLIWTEGSHDQDIFGIGTDSASGLDQRISRSSNNDSLVMVSNATSQDDGEFLVIGNNDGPLDLTSLDAPPGIEILGRNWRVDETATDDIGNIDIAFDITKLNLLPISPQELILLIDPNDTDFSDATIRTAANFSGGIVGFPNVNIPDGGFFTLGFMPQDDLGAIGNLVWRDQNGNQNFDTGEARFDGAILELYEDINGDGALDGGDSFITDATTQNGFYSFSGLNPGNYLVDAPHFISDMSVITESDTLAITLTAGQRVHNADFGYEKVGPGSVTDGLQLWLPASSFDPIASIWYDQSGNNRNGSIFAGGFTLDPFSINANPAVNFHEGSLLEIEDTFNTTGINAFGVANFKNTSGLNVFFGADTTADPHLPISQYNPFFDKLVLDSSFDYVELDLEGKTTFLHQMYSVGDDYLEGTIDGKRFVFGGTPPTTTPAQEKLYLGGILSLPPGTVYKSLEKDIAEAIVFDRKLTQTETQKINTYLLLKYGITMYDAAGSPPTPFQHTEYLSSDGTRLWAESSANAVIGIGKDNLSGFNQITSQSLNDPTLIIGPASSQDHGDFLLVDHKNQPLELTTAGTPASIRYRLERLWRAEETGDIGNIDITFDLSDIVAPSLPTDIQDYKLLVDDNGLQFIDGTIVDADEFSGSTVTFKNVDINHLDFFTLGLVEEAESFIGDLVWKDYNLNGVQDVFEPGIEFANINLYNDVNGDGVLDPGDTLHELAITDADGIYTFDDLQSGQYLVDIQPGFATFGLSLTTGVDPHPVTLGFDQQYTSADFGYAGRGAIAGEVFNDVNGNGIKDDGESGIGDINLNLYRDMNSNGVIDPGEPVIRTYTSDTGTFAGFLSFHDLFAGDYLVEVDVDESDILTGAELTTSSNPLPVTLATDSEGFFDANFGYRSNMLGS